MKSMTISIAGEASIKENTVLVDDSELRELVAINVQLLEALKMARNMLQEDIADGVHTNAYHAVNEAIKRAEQ